MEAGASFIPVVGSALATKEAVENPNWRTIGSAGLSWLADASLLVPLAGPAINGGLKAASTGLRATNLATKTTKTIKAANTANRILSTTNLANEVINTGQELVQNPKQTQNPTEGLITQVYQKEKIPNTI